jgi:hypothetical protein
MWMKIKRVGKQTVLLITAGVKALTPFMDRETAPESRCQISKYIAKKPHPTMDCETQSDTSSIKATTVTADNVFEQQQTQ